MTSRQITIAGFALLTVSMLVLVAAGRTERLARAGDLLDGLLARRSTRIVVVLVWWWLGWHILARTE